jgi:CubicO group peptidase (beta-lactamase class C family)
VARNAFGVATYLDPGRRLGTDAVFGISSASKPITATAIMQLVESGALSLNRPLIEYIPEVSGDGAQSHTGCITF